MVSKSSQNVGLGLSKSSPDSDSKKVQIYDRFLVAFEVYFGDQHEPENISKTILEGVLGDLWDLKTLQGVRNVSGGSVLTDFCEMFDIFFEFAGINVVAS